MPQLADKDKCTGCTACASVCPANCIEMQRDENGFAHPLVSDLNKCIECGACEVVCPIQDKPKVQRKETQAFAAYSKNDTLRAESSSGGIFSEIAKIVLDNGGIVFGAKYDKDFNVCHAQVDNTSDLKLLRGAKYAESWLGDTFSTLQEKLNQGRQVLFTGAPCQVAGLKAFLKDDYDNLICIDFICHSIPSPMVWEKYLEYRANNDADGQTLEKINLRDKSTGWSHYHYSNYFKYSNGIEQREVSTQSIYMKLFTEDYISRQSCANCRFKGYSRISDITLGDFWGIWEIAPEMDDDRGTSVVLIHSEKGQEAWKAIREQVVIKPVCLVEVCRSNPSIISSSKAKEERDALLRSISRKGFSEDLLEKKTGRFWRIGLMKKLLAVFKNNKKRIG